MDSIYSTHPLPILESRLDWLSATIKPGQRQTVLKGRVAAWIADRVGQGYDFRSFQTPFYKGQRTDGIAWGERTEDCSITLSGVMASRHGPTLITWADTISRCDVQLTVQDPALDHDWARYVDRLMGLDERVKSEQLTTRLYSQRPKGVTSYVGDGASDRVLRTYDKTAESDDHYPPGCWRFEVQYRHQRSALVARKLLDHSVLAQACLAAVCAAYRDYRIDVPVLCIPSGWSDAGITPATDNDRRLAWLRRSVAPCVSRLVDHFGLETILDALDLNAVIDTLEEMRATLDFQQSILDGDISVRTVKLESAPGALN